ncbi:MAG: sortase [Bacilli bacterium]|nr:sortase [Bacilli bacterium]
MQRKKIKNKHKGHLLIIGVLLILIGIGTLIYKYYQRNEISNIEENNIIEFYEIQEDISVNQEEIDKKTDEVQEEVKVEKNVEKESYLAVLKIDKIKLERGIYNINSKNNNVNKNIKILKESDMPDKENGNVIIAGHSGSSYIAYFKNLVKLNNGDEAKIFYNGKTYIYNLVRSYEVEKTGKITLSKNKDKQTLTLITCKTNTNKQIVFVFEIKNII